MEYLKPTLVLAGQAASLVLGIEPGGSEHGNANMQNQVSLFELGLDD
jgi:hypothetical protein